MFKTYKIGDFLNYPFPEKTFHINKLSESERAHHIERPHKHDFYEIFLIKRGNVTQSIDHQDYKLSDNTLFFISKGQLHIWETTENAEEGYRLMFTDDFLLQYHSSKNFLFKLVFLDNIYKNPYLQLSDNQKLIYIYFDCLWQEYQKPDAKLSSLSALLFILLTELQYIFNKQNFIKTSQKEFILYQKFIYLLEEKFISNLSVGDYAVQLFISSRHLNRVVQQVTQQSASRVIQNRMVLEAKRLLTFTTLNINQIAEYLNFEDSSYFARYFRRITNKSPIEFRQAMSEKYRNVSE